MFLIMNAEAEIYLESCNWNVESNKFLASKNYDNKNENFKTIITLTLKDQIIEGDFIVDNEITLNIKMINSKIIRKINPNKSKPNISIDLDSDSTIILNRNYYISSLRNEDSSGNNIKKGDYILADYYGIKYPIILI